MANELRRFVAELDEKLLRNHRQDNELFERLTSLQRSSGLIHGDRPFSPFLRPYFLERSRYEQVRDAAKTLSGCFEKLTAAALRNPEVMERLGLTEKEEIAARLEPGYGSVSVTS